MNSHRGEIAINSIVLHPTFTALAAIEQQTGRSLIGLARALANGTATLADLKTIVEQSATMPLPADFFETVNLLDLQEQLLGFLINALTGETNAKT